MIVIDASVVMKWFEEETDSEAALALLTAHTRNEVKIVVPLLLFYEVANALTTKSQITMSYINKGLNVLFRANLFSHPYDESEIQKASRLAKQYSTSVYDMIYAVIAKHVDTILITADEKFLAKTKFRHVKLLSEYRP